MISLTELDRIIQEARNCRLPDDRAAEKKPGTSSFDTPAAHVLYQGDSCAVMRDLLKSGHAGSFQCIYLDPPFLSGADYQATVKIRSERLGEDLTVKVPAYDDSWRSADDVAAYFRILAEALVLARELLADDGLLWLHLDWHTVHYARVMLDRVFGEERFLNEIIWQYKSGGSSRRHFARKHDTILLYAKSAAYRIHVDKEKSYNRGFKPYRFKGVEEYEDETGWYTLVNAKDVWSIDMVGRTAAERNGYATQKPLALMERIVAASSDPGDAVGDFCCGSGGFLEAAARMGRRTAGCDRSALALALTEKRLRDAGIGYQRITVSRPDTADVLQRLKPDEKEKLKRIAEQDPEALVLFREQLADGGTRIVDLFGEERFLPKTEE